jgi:hypothetical protein
MESKPTKDAVHFHFHFDLVCGTRHFKLSRKHPSSALADVGEHRANALLSEATVRKAAAKTAWPPTEPTNSSLA